MDAPSCPFSTFTSDFVFVVVEDIVMDVPDNMQGASREAKMEARPRRHLWVHKHVTVKMEAIVAWEIQAYCK